ncbi:hypothetical protein RHODO2019_01755 [Rhodococcus antarcticus]|uniref:MFS transporter n=1 Tax=Rhodococcus antarcticus TaxID=2987751 RepID=A0ABY6P189_9NOCA|nr:hypothetical protein [Rhodococcus antarcticus]UZJ25249.1 hypothetical protein RHODO2019_01755 [Rhodococcus antarcticus]
MTGADGGNPRPRQVSAGYWMFVLSGVALVLLGLYALLLPHDTVRQALRDRGVAEDVISSALQLLVVQGATSVLGGLVVGFLAAGVRRGDPRFRRAEVAVSALLVILQLGSFVLGLGGTPLVAIALIAACVLVFLPSTAAWFTPAEPAAT